MKLKDMSSRVAAPALLFSIALLLNACGGGGDEASSGGGTAETTQVASQSQPSSGSGEVVKCSHHEHDEAGASPATAPDHVHEDGQQHTPC